MCAIANIWGLCNQFELKKKVQRSLNSVNFMLTQFSEISQNSTLNCPFLAEKLFAFVGEREAEIEKERLKYHLAKEKEDI